MSAYAYTLEMIVNPTRRSCNEPYTSTRSGRKSPTHDHFSLVSNVLITIHVDACSYIMLFRPEHNDNLCSKVEISLLLPCRSCEQNPMMCYQPASHPIASSLTQSAKRYLCGPHMESAQRIIQAHVSDPRGICRG
jgi:hypothetical protein